TAGQGNRGKGGTAAGDHAPARDQAAAEGRTARDSTASDATAGTRDAFAVAAADVGRLQHHPVVIHEVLAVGADVDVPAHLPAAGRQDGRLLLDAVGHVGVGHLVDVQPLGPVRGDEEHLAVGRVLDVPVVGGLPPEAEVQVGRDGVLLADEHHLVAVG